MRIEGVIGDQNFLDAGQTCCRLADFRHLLSRDKDMDRAAERCGCGERLCRRLIEAIVLDLGEQQDRHQMTLASCLSLLTSSAAEASLIPALRTGGSKVFKIVRRGAMSRPNSAASFSSITFFFAFIMFGSVG